MLTKVYNEPRIFQIDVPLPDNPLRNLNCYVVQDGGETLIIDTGFNRPECREALLEGLAELDANWEKTNLFLTHLHSDHTGLAPTLMEDKPGKIYISATDHRILWEHMKGARWQETDALFIGRASRESSLQSCGFQTLRVVWSQPVILKRSMLRMGMKLLSADGNSPVCPFLGTHRDRCVCTARRKS